MAPNVHLKNVTLAYHQKIIFSGLNLFLPAGQWTSLIGPSGAGKTSLLRVIAGLVKSTNETVQGECYAENALPLFQQIAYMAQTDLLLPWMSVIDNITLGIKLRSAKSHEYSESYQTATALLRKVNLQDTMHLYPHQLSGGMRQRVALVRTFMENKPIVLMDEPFTGLDAIARYKLQDLAANLLRNKTVLFISHDLVEALRLSHKIYMMLPNHPSPLKEIAHLDSSIPRSMTNAELMALQPVLFQELMHATSHL